MSVVVDGKPADRAWNIPPLVRGAGGELPEGFALGEWTVTHLRGTEASCEVYLVTHAVDGSSCVARVARRSALAARPGLAGAMLAGAKQLGKLRHPNLLAVCGHGWTDETSPRPYVLHERVVGRDLAAYQARHGAVEPGLLLAIACQCAAALAAITRLLNQREDPLPIMGLLAWQLAQLAKAKEFSARPREGKSLGQLLKMPPSKIAGTVADANRWSLPQLQRAFRILAATDAALKGARKDREMAVVEAVMALCGAPGMGEPAMH